MSWLLLFNNASSAVVVLACWWLAHQNARSRPPGRLIAAGFALLGFSFLIAAILRNLGIPPDWPLVLAKGLLAATLVLLSFRRAKGGGA